MDSFSLTNSEKHASIMKWLKSIFGDEPIPTFLKTDSFLNHLHELMLLEVRLQGKSHCYRDFIVASVKDYEDASATIGRVLESAGVVEEKVAAMVALDNLALIAGKLSLADVEDSSYILSLSELALEKEKTTSEIDALSNTIKSSSTDLSDGIRLSSQLEVLTAKLTEQKEMELQTMHSREQDATFLLQKVEKYKTERRKQENILSKSGVTRNITHESIVADHNELKELISKLKNTQEQLDMFSDLPPDKQLARVKLEVARSELHDIENQLAQQIDMFHL